MTHSSPEMKFAQCAVGSQARAWFIAEEDDQFRLLQLKDGKWAARSPEWPIGSICGSDEPGKGFEVIGLGIDGELLIGTPGKFIETHLDPLSRGPDRYGVLREVRRVGEDVFAAGMSRQVYRRRAGVWSDVAGPIRESGPGAIGFNSIHGASTNAVFAVGFGGEVWFFDGSCWIQLDSPTSVALNRVLALQSGHVLICGAGGVLLQGKPDALATIKNEVTKENLYGMTEFKGRIFLSSAKSLFVLGQDGLEKQDTGLDGPLTFGNLEAQEDVIWSVGARHLLRSFDGVVWEQVFCQI